MMNEAMRRLTVSFYKIFLIIFLGLKNFNDLVKKKCGNDEKMGEFKPPQSEIGKWNDAISACAKMSKNNKRCRLNLTENIWKIKDVNKSDFVNFDFDTEQNFASKQISSNGEVMETEG